MEKVLSDKYPFRQVFQRTIPLKSTISPFCIFQKCWTFFRNRFWVCFPDHTGSPSPQGSPSPSQNSYSESFTSCSGEGFYSTAQALETRGTMHSDSPAALASTYPGTLSGMYPRVPGVSPYETAWPYNFAAAQAQAQSSAAALKNSQDSVSSNAAAAQTAAWWTSMHSATNWLSAAETAAANTAASLQLPVHSKTVSPTDYAAGFTSFGSNPASYLSTGHNLLGDTYKSMLPSAAAPQSSIPSTMSSAFLPRTPGLPSMGLAAAARSPRRGYTGRSTCDCPNCVEADRLGPAGANFRRNIHSCHIAGCGGYQHLYINTQFC